MEWLLYALAALFLFLALVLLITYLRQRSWPIVEGTVVDNIEHDSEDGDRMWTPVLEVVDSSGKAHRGKTNVSVSPPYEIGRRMQVRQHPADKSRFVSKKVEDFLIAGIVFLGMGVTILLVAIFAT